MFNIKKLIYIYIYIHTHIYTHIYIYTEFHLISIQYGPWKNVKESTYERTPKCVSLDNMVTLTLVVLL